MKKIFKYLLLGLVLVIVVAIYQGAKSDGKIIGLRLKYEGKVL